MKHGNTGIAQLIQEVKSKVVLHSWATEKLLSAARAHSEADTLMRNGFPLRPSSALKSMRDLYYGLVNFYRPGTIPTDPISNPILLDLGHTIEGHLVKHLERAFTIVSRNQRVDYGRIKTSVGETTLSGELDFCIVTEKGETVICDSKSSAAFPFETGKIPKEEHIAQINLYMHSSWARERNINRALIIYYNKNNSQVKFYEFQYSAELAEAVIARFQTVHDMYERTELPAREHVYGRDWQANYSSFKTYDLEEFSAPAEERMQIDDDEFESLGLEEVIGFVCQKHGNAIVNGYYLVEGAKGLLLKKLKNKGENKLYGT